MTRPMGRPPATRRARTPLTTMLDHETASLRTGFESSALRDAMTRGALSLADFQLQLWVLMQLHREVEAAVATGAAGPSGHWSAWTPAMAKSQLLLHDLIALGGGSGPIPPHVHELLSLANLEIRRSGHDAAVLAGWIYVLEAVADRGTELMRPIVENLGDDCGGLAYYRAAVHGAALRARLDAAVPDLDGHARALEGARAAWTALRTCFDAIAEARVEHPRPRAAANRAGNDEADWLPLPAANAPWRAAIAAPPPKLHTLTWTGWSDAIVRASAPRLR